jgi:phage shock protein PspC (stress-responsive transcriptional regulator)
LEGEIGMNKRIYRSRQNKMIAGVCGGIAEYFNIDPTIVRLVTVVFTLTYGMGLLAYIIAAIVIPENNSDFSQSNYGTSQNSEPAADNSQFNGQRKPDGKGYMIIGAVLILCGGALLARRFFWFDLSLLWPVILVAIGLLVIFSGIRR